MTRTANAKLRVYPALAGLGLIGALALGRPELAAIAAPFAVFVGVGLALARRPELRIFAELERERQIEGRHVGVELEVAAARSVERLELLFELPDGLEAEEPNPRLVRLAGGEGRSFEIPVRCVHWGAHELGQVLWRAGDAFGLVSFEASSGESTWLKVYPRGEALGNVLRPLETQAFSGNQVARTRGEGIEFADLRPFTPGDRVRRVNWRATARRGAPWVNEAHPERNADVVIFLDTFAEARKAGTSTLDLGVRAAATLASHYLKEKDRVGLVSFGGVLNWLTVSSGMTQLYRIVDSLLDAEIALSPLLDERAIGALTDLRARGFDLAVLELSPFPFIEEDASETGQLALRLWRLRREALRSRYAALGVAIVEWTEGVPIGAVIEEVRGFRRHARVLRA